MRNNYGRARRITTCPNCKRNYEPGRGCPYCAASKRGRKPSKYRGISRPGKLTR